MQTRRNLFRLGLACAALLSAIPAGAQPVTKIAAGSGHSLFLKSDGSLWTMGTNNWGQLGNGSTSNGSRPKMIVTNGVVAVAGGFAHSLLVLSNSALWAMGANSVGQLGDGTYNQTNRPEPTLSSNVTAVAAGYQQSLLLKGDGSLWTVGDNELGQLGNGTTIPYTNRPGQIVASNVVAVSAGDFHSLFLKVDGSLWGMGYNYYGQLGNGHSGSGANASTPVEIEGSNVTAIAAGGEHSLFLKNDGSLWAMGSGAYGQLGDGSNNLNGINVPEQIVASNVTAIAAGEYHSLFLKSDGSLWGMGNNFNGELGDGTINDTNRPERIVTNGVTMIAGGAAHSLFVKIDGSLWAMGGNGGGQLGDGTSIQTNRPEEVVTNASYDKIFKLVIGSPLVSSGSVILSFYGNDFGAYALDRCFDLALPKWIPQATNLANAYGLVLFTNTPDANAPDDFWRVRLVP